MEKIIVYLTSRGISLKAIEEAKIDWNGRDIIIPIFNENRDLISYKFRRSPFTSIGPKYHYHKGSEMALYNIHTINDKNIVFIVEGELDALAMQSRGFTAVSSTSGSGSFKKEWEPIFRGKTVYICYDNDLAGIKGSYNVQKAIPYAKIVWLPEEMPDKGKDITDYLNLFSVEQFERLIQTATQYVIPPDLEGEFDAEEECEKAARMLARPEKMLQRLKHLDRNKKYLKETVLCDIYRKRYDSLKKKYRKAKIAVGAGELARACSNPMIEYISFDHSGFAKCPWHDDRTPSLKYYPEDNHAFCFGGCGRKSAIDACMLFDKLSFPEAVAKLSS